MGGSLVSIQVELYEYLPRRVFTRSVHHQTHRDTHLLLLFYNFEFPFTALWTGTMVDPELVPPPTLSYLRRPQ